MPTLPDTRYSLLARLAEPADAAAWSEFIDIYQLAIFRYSRARGLQEADAWEVVQQVLLTVHRAMADWKPTGRKGSFRAWLVRTAHFACMRAFRERARSDRATGGTSVGQMLSNVALAEAPQDEQRDWERWAFCWAAGQVQREIEKTTWQAFWLTAVEGLPPAEVAAQLDMKVGTVYAAKCRVLARIRERTHELSRGDL